MSGPPTPPPTSAIEIQDAARASVPPVDTAEPIETDPPVPAAAPEAGSSTSTKVHITKYQSLFPTIAELAARGDYQELVKVAERGDLNGELDHHASRLLLTAPLVLSYLILDNLPPARFALTRLPIQISHHPLAKSLLVLLSAVWEKQYDKVYTRAGDLLQVIQQPPISGYDLGPLVERLANTFLEAFRRKTFNLLTKAYSSIPLVLAQGYLGLQPERVLAGKLTTCCLPPLNLILPPVASEHNWAYHEGTKVLTPSRPDPFTQSRGVGFESSPTTLVSVTNSLISDSI